MRGTEYLRRLTAAAAETGFVITPGRTSTGHVRLRHPCGAEVTASYSPRCPYALDKVKADMRRALRRAS